MQTTSFHFEAIGTTWQIQLQTIQTIDKPSHILQEVKDKIETFDKTYSRFRKDSLISKIAKEKGTYKLPEDSKSLFVLYEKLYHLSSEAFTPLIGSTLVDAGYDEHYSLKSSILQDVSKWENVIEYHFPNLLVKKPVMLDFGAGGKGYLIDLVAGVLKKNKITNFVINGGGDILQKTTSLEKLKVGMENPTNTSQIIGVVQIQNKSICASAGNRRKWGIYHHIMNPFTKSSPSHILGTWVVADTAILADALSTCLFFTDPKILLKEFSFSYAILYPDFSLKHSENFPAKIFT